MGLDWNPDFPRKLGVEHEGIGFSQESISAPSRFVPMSFEAQRTGQVDFVQLYAGPGASSTQLDGRYENLYRPMVVDLFDADIPHTFTGGIDTFLPTSVAAIGNIVNENLTSPPNVNRITAPDDGLFLAAPSLGSGVQITFNTGAFPLDRRIHQVTIGIKVNLTSGIRRVDPGGAPWFINLPAWSSNTRIIEFTWGELKVDGGTGTWSHWTPQQIRDFRAGGNRAVRVTAQAGPGYWNFDYAYLKVLWSGEERMGLGIGIPLSGLSWIPFTLYNPNGAPGPSLGAGTRYEMLARRMVDYSLHGVAIVTMPWRRINGRDPGGNWRAGRLGLGNAPAIPPAFAEVDGVYCVRFSDNGQIVEDSQPYSLERSARIWDTQDVTQTLVVSGAATSVNYGQAYVLAGFNFDSPRPEAPLICEVRLVSDDSLVFSPVSITADQVAQLEGDYPRDDQNTTYRLVKFRFPETKTLLAGSYYLRLHSPGTTEARAWRVAALIGEAHTVNQTYGGTTAVAEGVYVTAAGNTQLTDATHSSDLQAMLVDVPAAVENVDVEVGAHVGHHAESCLGPGCPGGGCSDQTITTAVLTWDAAPSGTPDVDAYEVQRTDDAPNENWATVAIVRGRLTTTWEDHEPRLDVRTVYRVRVIREDGVTGDWSDEMEITLPAGQDALVMTSNAATGMGLVYPEVWTGSETDREWSFLAAGDVEFTTFYGRNGQVAFRPIEDRGIEFSRTLMLNLLCAVTPPTMNIFEALLDLSRAPIPYVCVRDGEGNRWFMAMLVPTGVNLRPGERWFANVRFVQVTDTPHAQDTDTPQVTEPASLS